MRRTGPALAAMLLAAQASAEVAAPGLAGLVDEARAECAGFDGGVLDVPDAAGIRTDLTGDGRGWILDYAQMSCSTAASLFCGSGGCLAALVVGDHVTTRMSQGLEVVTFGAKPVVLIEVHGSLCGGINPTPCVEALVWDGEAGRFSTVAPRPE